MNLKKRKHFLKKKITFFSVFKLGKILLWFSFTIRHHDVFRPMFFENGLVEYGSRQLTPRKIALPPPTLFFFPWGNFPDTVEYTPCTNKTGKILLCITYVVFLKITTFLWLTLKLHPGYTDFFVETARIKFIGSRGQRTKNQGPKYGTECREKK